MEHWGMGAAASLGASLSSRVETCGLSIEAIFYLSFFLSFFFFFCHFQLNLFSGWIT